MVRWKIARATIVPMRSQQLSECIGFAVPGARLERLSSHCSQLVDYQPAW